MATKILIMEEDYLGKKQKELQKRKLLLNKQDYVFIESYCRESPEEVFAVLVNKAPIYRFMNITPGVMMGFQGMGAEIVEDKVSITQAMPPTGVEITGSVQDLILPEGFASDYKKENRAANSVDGLIRKHLVTVKSPSNSIAMTGRGPEHFPDGPTEVSHYFQERAKQQNESLEIIMPTIILYAQAMFDNPAFGEKQLINRCKRIYKQEVKQAKKMDKMERESLSHLPTLQDNHPRKSFSFPNGPRYRNS